MIAKPPRPKKVSRKAKLVMSKVLVPDEIGVVHDQDRHADHARNRHIDDVQKHGQQARGSSSASMKVLVCCGRNTFSRNRGRVAVKATARRAVEPLDQEFQRHAPGERGSAHEEQCAQHGRNQRHDHDGLDGKGEGVDEFLNGQRDD